MSTPRTPRIVTFDLMPDDPDYYFVLTEALGDFAARQRADAEDDADPGRSIRWAETAESALDRIEAALSAGPQPEDKRRTIGSLTHADFGSLIEIPGVIRGTLWAVQHTGVMGDHREAVTRVTVLRHGASEATRGLPADTGYLIVTAKED